MSKIVKLDKDVRCGLKQSKAEVCVDTINLNGYDVLGHPLQLKYRFVVSGKEEFQKIAFKGFTKNKDGIVLHSCLSFSEDEQYAFDLRLTRAAHQHAGMNFNGVAFRWEPVGKVPWATEIIMDVPLNINKWDVFVQDLYTKYKQAKVTKDWAGVDNTNWQGARSPLEFAATDGMAIWGRLETLNKMFSSRAVYDKKKGPLFQYKFSFDSQSKKVSPEFSLLLASSKSIASQSLADFWLDLFNTECRRFRKAAGVKDEKLVPMANLPIDGGTPGCAPRNKLKVRGSFDETAEDTLNSCEEMNYKRILVGSPWISLRTEKINAKCMHNITYDSRCGIIDFEISPVYGGREAFKRFCRKAHSKGIEVFVWYPAFHLSNYSPHLTKHPEWIIRRPDGAASTFVYFHLSILSPRLEVQKYFLDQLKGLKRDCEFDGLWLDSYNNFSFMDLDYSVKHGVSCCREGIGMVKEFQKLGFKVINEGFSPFGARGDGEAMFYYGQEHMASETGLYTDWRHVEKITEGGSYFRFLANKAPLTLPPKYIPAKQRAQIAEFNRQFLEVEKYMQKRTLLDNDLGVLWKNSSKTEVLFAFKNADLKLPDNVVAIDLSSRESQEKQGAIKMEKQHIYILRHKGARIEPVAIACDNAGSR